MPRFPKKEANIVALAQSIIAGVTANPTIFPAPPFTAVQMQAMLDVYFSERDEVTAAEAAWKQKIQDKNDALEVVEAAMKDELGYSEQVAKSNAAILAMVGWGLPAPPTPLQPPGQARLLEVIHQGEGWVEMDWKEPVGGGKVASYKIQRRQEAGDWQDVGVAVDSIGTVNNQPRKVDLEFRVVALNKAGDGMPSNTIAITL